MSGSYALCIWLVGIGKAGASADESLTPLAETNPSGDDCITAVWMDSLESMIPDDAACGEEDIGFSPLGDGEYLTSSFCTASGSDTIRAGSQSCTSYA